MKKVPVLAGVLAIAMSLFTMANAFADAWKFKVGDPDGKDLVRFNSDAPVEVITGTTSKIKGNIDLDKSFQFDAKHPFKINFAVDLPSIDTGIALRNEHMRDNFLETDKYPKATFVAKSVKVTKKPSFNKIETVNLVATGDFTLHGVTVKKTIPLKVTYIPEGPLSKKRVEDGNMIRIQGTFPVKLAEHKIQRPEAIFVKLAETVFVTIDTIGTDGSF